MNLSFLETVSKILQASNLKKIRPVKSSCTMRAGGRTEGQTDVTRLLVAFRNFANAPKNCKLKCGFQNPQSVT